MAVTLPLPPPANTPGDFSSRQWQSWFSQLRNVTSSISVSLQMPANTFTVTGSPVLNNGILGVTYNSQAANLSLMSPSVGAGTPTWRSITVNDIPFVSSNVLTWLNM